MWPINMKYTFSINIIIKFIVSIYKSHLLSHTGETYTIYVVPGQYVIILYYVGVPHSEVYRF